MSRRVIVRMKGGLGNQLFQYAAARRLAINNGAELMIDHTTGFVRDYKYRRRYMLDRFQVAGRLARGRDLLEPFGRLRRRLVRLASRRAEFEDRIYLEQHGFEWEPRLLGFQVRDWVYLEGYWQSERYFRDIAETIRSDLHLKRPIDDHDARVLGNIVATNSVAVHLRWFQPPDSAAQSDIGWDYYQRAISYIESHTPGAQYFVFSDNIEAARSFAGLPADRTTFMSRNNGDDGAHIDLFLMSRCKHFIIANSTFSWWGAWLSPSPDKIVIAPGQAVEGLGRWGFEGLIPDGWVTM